MGGVLNLAITFASFCKKVYISCKFSSPTSSLCDTVDFQYMDYRFRFSSTWSESWALSSYSLQTPLQISGMSGHYFPFLLALLILLLFEVSLCVNNALFFKDFSMITLKILCWSFKGRSC